MLRKSVTLVLLLLALAVRSDGLREGVGEFYHLDTSQGLPNAQVNWIMEDARGYMWFATASGLSRFDGFRFRNFFASADNELTLPDDNVRRLAEDGGLLWVGTHSGWCTYDALTETFNRHPDARTAAAMARRMEVMQLTDGAGNTWKYADKKWLIYSPRLKRWTADVVDVLRGAGIRGVTDDEVVVRDVKNDLRRRLWVATDHDGLLRIDWKAGVVERFVHRRDDDHSLPDNTIQRLYVDRRGALWVGTLKNGVAYFDDESRRFTLVPLGDVCTIAEDRQGRLWAGTNDAGIVCYDPQTGHSERYDTHRTGLGSEVVVSSMCASDGSLWFGTFQGGMARWDGNRWTTWRKSTDALLSDDVWALAEDRQGRVVVGTLNAGVQTYDAASNRWTAYKGLPGNYVASVWVDAQDRVLMGHSHYLSVLDLTTGSTTNYSGTRDGQQFANPSVNQVIEDSRGLVWIASQSGVNIYDPATGQLELLNADNGLSGNVACSLAEDLDHRVWVVTANGLSAVSPVRKGGRWAFELLNYDERDGLQRRQFNYRSILLTRKGDLVVGGQDGINIVSREGEKEMSRGDSSSIIHHSSYSRGDSARVLFSGLILSDHTLSVGERYGDRVVLKGALNEISRLDLKHNENTFTLLLASSQVACPSRTLFLYRLVGSDDEWHRTNGQTAQLTFHNLTAGKYRLQVQPLDRSGRPIGAMRELTIVVHPPFYLSPWAWLLYVLLAGVLLAWLNRYLMMRQRHRFELEQVRREAERDKELNAMKLRFFTNVSHEFRTPLSLVISPLQKMMADETDETKRQRLSLVHRNARKLLALVNELLDMRRLDSGKEQLHLSTGDVVGYVRNICQEFGMLQERQAELTFHSDVESLRMQFDEDKLGKIMNNLLSNAFKFTPAGGKVSVEMAVDRRDTSGEKLLISVADTGIGISDADKPHVFDRFYQADNHVDQPFGGSGIGLSLAKDFVEMHGGTIGVADNKGGGTVFTLELPVRSGEAEKDAGREDASAFIQPSSSSHDGEKPYEALIVDDSQDFLDFMTDVLKEHYRIRTAHNGREALKLIAERQPDIILSDVMMPEMDGNELCRAVKQHQQTAHIPFVMLTARMAQDHKIEGMENGADDYITKPFNLDLLNLRMANLIRWRQKAQGNGSAEGGRKIDPKVKEVEITSLDRQFVQAATDYVEQHMASSDMTVESLSEALNMSRVHLYKRMLSLTGNTPSEFIRLIRLQRAEQLLRQSQLSIAEISYKVGFNNPRYFSKYFKEMYGMMPSQYKEAKGC